MACLGPDSRADSGGVAATLDEIEVAERADVDGYDPANMSKSDQDPTACPQERGRRCGYTIGWVTIKHTWELTAGEPEVGTLRAAAHQLLEVRPTPHQSVPANPRTVNHAADVAE